MNTARRDKAITTEQRKMIFALYRELNIGEELRHDVQHGVAKKASLTDFTANDAGRLIEHLERLVGAGLKPARTEPAATKPLTSPPNKAGTPGVTFGSVPAPKLVPAKAGNQTKKLDSRLRGHDRTIHKLPSPEQLAVLDHLYAFAGYATFEAQRAFAARIEKHPRPRSMWEAEELIFALIAQAAPKMLAAISAEEFAGRLTPFEYAFMYTNTASTDVHGNLVKGTFNNAHYELTKYVEKHNKRGHRTMPRFSMTKFFEILGKYK